MSKKLKLGFNAFLRFSTHNTRLLYEACMCFVQVHRTVQQISQVDETSLKYQTSARSVVPRALRNLRRAGALKLLWRCTSNKQITLTIREPKTEQQE